MRVKTMTQAEHVENLSHHLRHIINDLNRDISHTWHYVITLDHNHDDMMTLLAMNAPNFLF